MAGDVWNLRMADGKLEGHFYWNSERHRYFDEFCIIKDVENVISRDADAQGPFFHGTKLRCDGWHIRQKDYKGGSSIIFRRRL